MSCKPTERFPCKVWGDTSEQLEYSVDDEDGDPIAFESGTITIYDSHNSKLVDAEAMDLVEDEIAGDTLGWTPTFAWTQPSKTATYYVWIEAEIAGALPGTGTVRRGPFPWQVLPFGTAP